MSVVDSELRVHDIDELLAIDASVMPAVISPHTRYGIVEKKGERHWPRRNVSVLFNG